MAIEPIVASFDPETGTLGDLSSADQATSEKNFELLDANDGNATYSCFAGCDSAVDAIKEQIAAEISAGTAVVEAMPFDDGVQLLGIYKAYLREVQTEACPRDALGNDEFDFIGTAG